MFLSGLQIDRWGNCNVTALGFPNVTLKLPGGGGGGNLSCDTGAITLWTAAHRATMDERGRRRFRLVEKCDFITNLGHRAEDGRSRSELGHRGRGPQWLVTELGLFDFDAEGHMRLLAVYPDTSVEEIMDNTGFAPRLAATIETIPTPEGRIVELIRKLDSLGVHNKELRAEDRRRVFPLAG
jgi:glutaconate CoA-transferase subunit B